MSASPPRDISSDSLRRVALRGEQHVRVKQLAGYQKGATLPDRAGPAALKHAARLAATDLDADIERHFMAIRENLGYKRRDVQVEPAEDGHAAIHTPDFEYHITVELAPDDPSSLIFRREVTGVRSAEILKSPAFQGVFRATFDTLVFFFQEAPDIARIVDDIEDRALPGVRVTCPSQCTWAEIQLPRLTCSVRIERATLAIHERGEADAGSLVDTFFSLQDFFTEARVRMLPP